MVIDLKAERERRKLERAFNPSPLREAVDLAVAYAVVGSAFCFVAWLVFTATPRG